MKKTNTSVCHYVEKWNDYAQNLVVKVLRRREKTGVLSSETIVRASVSFSLSSAQIPDLRNYEAFEDLQRLCTQYNQALWSCGLSVPTSLTLSKVHVSNSASRSTPKH